jgi:predicted nucleic acid-binding protein
MPTILIDSNIIISALIKEGITRDILTNFSINFAFPQDGLEEIYCCKTEILKKANITEREFNVLFLRILKYIQLIPLDMLFNFKDKAKQIMEDIDKDDVIFIAAALCLNCPIWSEDKHFKKQKDIKILTTKEVLETYCKEG